MARKTKIQWCHSTINPVMGCGGCELFAAPGKILKDLDRELVAYGGWSSGTSLAVYRELITTAYARISIPKSGHSTALSTTNIWHLRSKFLASVTIRVGVDAAIRAEGIIHRSISCYAAKLHLNKARAITSPDRGVNTGYAPVFERPTLFYDRVWQMAGSPFREDLHKPWLKGMPHLIFVSDMGDAFSRESDFEFLRSQVIAPILSDSGRKKIWIWLTKRPQRMARFASQLGGLPGNVWAMTTVTGPETLVRVNELRDVQASIRGLSIEPLWERIPPEKLNLEGIDWVILGGESGRQDCVRNFDLRWARELRDYCRSRGVAFFLKQLGRRPLENNVPLRLRDNHGGDWDEWPTDLRVREMPFLPSYTSGRTSEACQ